MSEEMLRLSRLCYQCGECTAACPLRRVSRFSPRRILYDLAAANADVLKTDEDDEKDLWNCLVCENCYIVCPQEVDFPALVLKLRSEEGGAAAGAAASAAVSAAASAVARKESLAHREFSEIASFMTCFEKGVPTDFGVGGETDEESEYGYFPGCLDYYDLFFDLGVNYHEIGDCTVRLLNAVGIKPRILSLKCCGHDALFQGNRKVFEKLAAYNTRKIKESGIKKLVVSCAEGFLTFKKYYELAASGGAEGAEGAEGVEEVERVREVERVEVLHISELLSERGEKLNFKAGKEGSRTVTVAYHDPCAFKRFGLYEAPREALKKAGAGVKLVELTHAKENAVCCGVSGMMNCNDRSKALRAFRLDEARAKKVDVLVTTCPKCLSHFSCLKRETERERGGRERGGEKEREEGRVGGGEYDFEVLDLSVFLGRLLK
ncbi:MAG: hypothetical protein C4B55_03680 [Candidatus Methanophagaceae archaeon]|nr:MAG: hypothetical protein C4B55_03680 [Methanophagales archaeon]